MALKMGKTKEDIEKLVEKKVNLLGQGDVTNDYHSFLLKKEFENFKVDKDDEEKLDRIIDNAKDKVVSLKLTDLSPSPKNTFFKASSEKRAELIASLKSYGQITPIIVRPKEYVENYKEAIDKPFEILVGHTRVSCLEEIAGSNIDEATVDAIITTCNDVDATLIINQSNIQREEVLDIEVARGYKNTYEALKRDKNANLRNVEISTSLSKGQTVPSRDEGKQTIEVVADMYGLNYKTLRRKMALAYCIDEVVELYQKKKITQEQIQSISKLSDEAQELVVEFMKKEKIKMTNTIAKELKLAYDKEVKNPTLEKSFPPNVIRNAMINNIENDEPKKIKKKINIDALPSELFPYNIEDRTVYIIKALKYIKENNISI